MNQIEITVHHPLSKFSASIRRVHLVELSQSGQNRLEVVEVEPRGKRPKMTSAHPRTRHHLPRRYLSGRHPVELLVEAVDDHYGRQPRVH